MLVVGQVFEEARIQIEEQGYEPEEVFDVVTKYEYGRLRVELDGYYNYVLKQVDGSYKLMRHEWYDYVGLFFDGVACVRHKNIHCEYKWNFIKTNGKFISDTWFDFADTFVNGFGKVCLGGKYNVINTDGKIISGLWFEETKTFENGYCPVKRENKWNFIDETGKLISTLWFDRVENFRYFPGSKQKLYANVKLDNKWNIIGINGKTCLDKWVDWIFSTFGGKLLMVKDDDRFNFINVDYDFISVIWFDHASPFINGISTVVLGNKYNFLKSDGNLLQGVWFDDVKDNFPFYQSIFTEVECDKKKLWVDKKGKIYENKFLVKWVSFVESCKRYISTCFWWWFDGV